MATYNTKAEVKAALKAARKQLTAANKSGDRERIQYCLKACEDVRDILDAWKGK